MKRPSRLGIVFVLSLVVGALRYRESLLSSRDLGDETAYLCAFQAAAQMANPYENCPRFLYLPAIAHAGGIATAWLGPDAVRATLRTLVLAGSATVATVSAAWTGWPLWAQAGLAATLMFSPPLAEGMEFGNLSAAVSGLTLLALASLARWPLFSGLLLACGLLVKPMALLLPVAMVSGLYRQNWRRLAKVLCPAGLLAAAGLFAGRHELASLTKLGGLHLPAHHNISVVRVLAQLGMNVPATLVALLVAILTVAAARWRSSDTSEAASRRVALAGTCGSLLALPVVWNHTFCLVLPVLALAFATALAHARKSWRVAQRARALLALALVVTAVLVVLQSDFVGDLDPNHGRVEALLAILPLMAPAALAIFIECRARQRPSLALNPSP